MRRRGGIFLGIAVLIGISRIWRSDDLPAPTLALAQGRVVAATNILQSPAPVAKVVVYGADGVEPLSRYLKLTAKVLPTDAETRERRALLGDVALIRRAKDQLTSAALDAEPSRALKFLIEGVRAGEPTAREALVEIVRDARVENTHLAPAVRQRLAESKAETLYEWAASDDSVVESLAGLLPGPVSRRLWQNVRTRLAGNLATSAELARLEKLPR